MNLDEYRQRTHCQAYSVALLSVAFCIGVAGLLGWIFDSELLKRIHPSLVTMKANTAVCLMFVAVSLFLVEGRSASPLKLRVSRLLAVVVALVGLITLSEHVFGWNSGLDQLLFHESRAEAGLSFPGRMGVAIASSHCSDEFSRVLSAGGYGFRRSEFQSIHLNLFIWFEGE